jgi:hypothetical protein
MTAPGRDFGAGEHPCTFGACGRTDTHPYAEGWRCDPHSPWARAGNPDPSSARYCLAICYCGTCPHRRSRVLAPITQTVIDIEAIRTGKRRASPGQYRDARRQRQERPA